LPNFNNLIFKFIECSYTVCDVNSRIILIRKNLFCWRSTCLQGRYTNCYVPGCLRKLFGYLSYSVGRFISGA